MAKIIKNEAKQIKRMTTNIDLNGDDIKYLLSLEKIYITVINFIKRYFKIFIIIESLFSLLMYLNN